MLRDINIILVKVQEEDNKVAFRKLAKKGDLYFIGVSIASYSQKIQSVAGEIIMLVKK